MASIRGVKVVEAVLIPSPSGEVMKVVLNLSININNGTSYILHQVEYISPNINSDEWDEISKEMIEKEVIDRYKSGMAQS